MSSLVPCSQPCCLQLAYHRYCGQRAGKRVKPTALYHGTSGEADTPAGKNLKATVFTGHEVFKKSDADLVAFTKKGKGLMPAWEEILTDDQLKSVIAYLHTLEKK